MIQPRIALALAALLVGCGSNPHADTTETSLTGKPQHTVTLPGISGLLSGVMADLYLQFDQTDDPTHAGPLISRGPSCVPATNAEKAACRSQCPDLNDPNLIKACNQKCTNLEDCISNVCAARTTANYVIFGNSFKDTFKRTCNNTNDSCPSCTVGERASVIEDVDLSSYVPDPIFRTVIVDPVSCRLNTFGINLRNGPGFNVNDWVTLEPGAAAGAAFHVQIKAFASDPTVRCTNGISPTLRSPTFDFYLNANVVNHHPALGVVANFTSHVDYAFDWAYSLDSKVNEKVTGTVNGILGRNQGQLNQQLENLLAARIQQVNGEQVDDFLDVHFDGDSIVVTYTPRCVNGVCSCTPDCGGKGCGTDSHCNVSCGTCKYGTCDDASGVCQCTPRTTCDGACGRIPNGCGGMLSCPACNCTPSCTGKKCGASDGCNGTCYGYCPAKRSCQLDEGGFKLCMYNGN